MKPGRELDALVAEKVMGWENVTMGSTGIPGGVEPGSNYRGMVPVPVYSTDIAAAWEVVESLRGEGGFMLVNHEGSDHWQVDIGGELAYAATAPFAICIAALRAVGVEVDDG